MEYLTSGHRFANLSLTDLLRARDQFHAHLIHKRNVIGTALGRYLIRNDGVDPNAERTLENSGVRDYSWPCVLVFVDRWVDEKDVGKRELPASDFVPKTIYMEDGKAVPICVVLAPPVLTPPARRAAPQLDPHQLQGGHPVVSTTQGVTYTGTTGCLLTDGHKVYALTSRHVAGAAGEKLDIGTTSTLQLARVPFEHVYPGWPGKHTLVNLDVALVEVDDVTRWSSGIERIGPIGPLAALSTYNLSLNLIGLPVRAHGAASGLMRGRVAALFYRYKSVGGFDYTADFLIGSRGRDPLPTLPGDSGAVWVVDGPTPEDRRRPIAVQWGGTVLGGDEVQTTFALASNLSTICRELNVDLYRGPSVAAFEYWGEVGHERIGRLATMAIENEKLHDFAHANRAHLGEISNYPDTVWKGPRPDENVNHYGDIDLARWGVKSLDELTPDAASLSTKVWRKYYADIKKAGGFLSPGLLPFRVWQVWNELVNEVRGRDGERPDTDRIIAAMSILSHYIGDACQTLHSSYLTHGDPFRTPQNKKSTKMLGLGKGYGGPADKTGVHSRYETKMISGRRKQLDAIVIERLEALGGHGMDLVTSGRDAAWETVELQRRSLARIPPMKLVNRFGKAREDGEDTTEVLWNEFGSQTAENFIDGCRVLAMLWDSAWKAGKGNSITSGLGLRDGTDLLEICEDPEFLPSMTLEDIDLDE